MRSAGNTKPMLLIKIILTPLLISLISIASVRIGPKFAGMLTGFPIVAGPITLFLYLEQGSEFALQSSHETLLAVLPATIFCFAYSCVANRFNIGISLLLALCCYAVSALATTLINLPPVADFLLVIIGIITCLWLMPSDNEASTGPLKTVEIIARMIMSVLLVLFVTFAGPLVGPAFSGYLTVFPVAAMTMAVFTHLQSPQVVTLLLNGLMHGLFSLAAFYLALILLAPHMLFEGAFVIATLAAIGIQVVLKLTKFDIKKIKNHFQASTA